MWTWPRNGVVQVFGCARGPALSLVWVLAMSAQTTGAMPASNPVPAAPAAPTCAAPEFRQFDFWVGEWDVTSGDKPAGRSRIESILDGCAILENWRGASGNEGKSLNTWNTASSRWEQYWVSGGSPLHLVGGIVDGRMVLGGRHVPDPATGKARIERITWTPNADGSVRQLWESSDDEGKTWNVGFDGLYRKATIASPSHT